GCCRSVGSSCRPPLRVSGGSTCDGRGVFAEATIRKRARRRAGSICANSRCGHLASGGRRGVTRSPMISPRIIMYAGMAGLAWTFLRRYLRRQDEGPRQLPITEDNVVPGVDRRGDDAVCHLSLSAEEARTGKSLDVPSIDGPQRIQVPAGV